MSLQKTIWSQSKRTPDQVLRYASETVFRGPAVAPLKINKWDFIFVAGAITGRTNKPGAGRPKGSLGQRTKALRAIADEAIAAGITPIEVMLDNMRFYHEKADVLLTAVVAGVRDGKKKPIELLELMKELGSFRDKAQSCAVDAAPYVHPRLSASQADVNVKVSVEEAEQAFKLVAGAMNAADSGEIFVPQKKSKVVA